MTVLGSTATSAGSSASSAIKTSVSRATATASGVVTDGYIRMSVTGGSATPRMVMYANNGGAPGAKLGESTPVTISNTTVAGIHFTFAAGPSIVDGTDYFLGAAWPLPTDGSINIFRATSDSSGRKEVAALAPDPFGTATSLSGPIDAYVNYSPATDTGVLAASILMQTAAILGTDHNTGALAAATPLQIAAITGDSGDPLPALAAVIPRPTIALLGSAGSAPPTEDGAFFDFF